MPADGPPDDDKNARIQLSPELRRVLTSLHDSRTRAAAAAQPVLDAAARAAPSLRMQRLLQELATSLRPTLESGWLREFQQRIQGVATMLGSATRVINAAMQNAENMGRMGWTMPMNASLHDGVGLLLEAAKGPEATDAAFDRFYNKDNKESLVLLLTDLRQHERIVEFGPLLEEVAFGLDHEKYRLVVTALIPLFEGVTRRCWVDGVWQTADRERFFARKVAASEEGSFDRIVWVATRAFVERLYERNFPGDPKPLALNRHWILHGRGPADASLVDALRLLQAIHTVISLADEEDAEAANRAT